MASWFRSWHGAPTDNKWLVIASRANVAPGIVSAVYWALLDHASQADVRGSVAGFDIETYCAFSRFSESDVDAVLTALRDKKVIDSDDRLTAWDKRQPKREDDSSDRVRDWRAKRNEVTQPLQSDVTQRNARKRSVTHGNTTDTDTDTDTEQNRTETRDTLPPPPQAESAASGYEQARKLRTLNGQLGPELRTPLANALLDVTGKRRLADVGGAEGDKLLMAAHEAAVTLYRMGLKSESDILALEPAWGEDWRGVNGGTAKQFLEFVSERQAGKTGKRSGSNGRTDTSRGFGLASLTTDADREYHASNTPEAIAKLQAEWDAS